MTIINDILGNLATWPNEGREVDLLEIEWFESAKKIHRRFTNGGVEVAIRFTREGQRLRQNDVVYADGQRVVCVHIRPCEAIVISPATMLEMGTVCYEIGNKHMPLFIEDSEVLMPYEEPMFKWLEASGYQPEKQVRQLLNWLKSNVEPHGHGGSEQSLFSKIINLASSVSK